LHFLQYFYFLLFILSIFLSFIQHLLFLLQFSQFMKTFGFLAITHLIQVISNQLENIFNWIKHWWNLFFIIILVYIHHFSYDVSTNFIFQNQHIMFMREFSLAFFTMIIIRTNNALESFANYRSFTTFVTSYKLVNSFIDSIWFGFNFRLFTRWF